MNNAQPAIAETQNLDNLFRRQVEAIEKLNESFDSFEAIVQSDPWFTTHSAA